MIKMSNFKEQTVDEFMTTPNPVPLSGLKESNHSSENETEGEKSVVKTSYSKGAEFTGVKIAHVAKSNLYT